jgi:hypothetical protein
MRNNAMHWSIAAGRGILLAAMALLPTGVAQAATSYSFTRSFTPAEYSVGELLQIKVDVSLSSDGNVNSVGLEETLPVGWSFAGIASGITPVVQPSVGKEGLLEFAWFPLPPLPNFSFTYQVNIAPESLGTRTLLGRGIAFVDQVEILSPTVESKVVRSGSGTPHNADQDDDFVLSLTELLRVVQFFTLGSYSCPLNPVFTEDGFFAGSQGTQLCAPHDSDFSGTADYAIDLNELLRLIQLYNAGTYHSCGDPGSDDGFCAGPPD